MNGIENVENYGSEKKSGAWRDLDQITLLIYTLKKASSGTNLYSKKASFGSCGNSWSQRGPCEPDIHVSRSNQDPSRAEDMEDPQMQTNQ